MLFSSTNRVNSFSGSWPVSIPDIDDDCDIDIDWDTDDVDPGETMILTEAQMQLIRDEAKAYVEDARQI